jgi:hypothetical protein
MSNKIQIDPEYLRLLEAVAKESRAVEVAFNEFMFGDVEELNLTDLVLAIADLDEYSPEEPTPQLN